MQAFNLPGKSTGATDLLQGPMAYSYRDLMSATNNFSNEHKLGEGAFGEVYKVCGLVYIYSRITPFLKLLLFLCIIVASII